jgi:hypothetical protein
MDIKSLLTFLGITICFILLLVFRSKIRRFFDRLSGWLPRGFMHWLSTWRSYLGKNTRRLFSFLWDSLEFSSVLILLFSATLSALYLYSSQGKPFSLEAWGALEALSAMLGLMALGSVFLVFLVVFATFFVLSLHHKGRKIADGIFAFAKPTKLEALEERTGKIEGRLTSLEKRVEKVEDNLKKVGDGVTSINTRLGNIETTLTEMVTKGSNHAKRQPSQKSGRGKIKRVKK